MSWPPSGVPVTPPSMTKAVTRRAWHMWGIAIVSVGFLGLAILVSAGIIADSLDAYCPETPEVIYRPA